MSSRAVAAERESPPHALLAESLGLGSVLLLQDTSAAERPSTLRTTALLFIKLHLFPALKVIDRAVTITIHCFKGRLHTLGPLGTLKVIDRNIRVKRRHSPTLAQGNKFAQR